MERGSVIDFLLIYSIRILMVLFRIPKDGQANCLFVLLSVIYRISSDDFVEEKEHINPTRDPFPKLVETCLFSVVVFQCLVVFSLAHLSSIVLISTTLSGFSISLNVAHVFLALLTHLFRYELYSQSDSQ